MTHREFHGARLLLSEERVGEVLRERERRESARFMSSIEALKGAG